MLCLIKCNPYNFFLCLLNILASRKKYTWHRKLTELGIPVCTAVNMNALIGLNVFSSMQQLYGHPTTLITHLMWMRQDFCKIITALDQKSASAHRALPTTPDNQSSPVLNTGNSSKHFSPLSVADVLESENSNTNFPQYFFRTITYVLK